MIFEGDVYYFGPNALLTIKSICVETNRFIYQWMDLTHENEYMLDTFERSVNKGTITEHSFESDFL